MTVLAFGAYEPDKQNYQGATSKMAQNVVPRTDGYGPWKAFSVYSQPLAEGNDTFTKVLLHCNGTDTSTTFTDDAAGATVAHSWIAVDNAQIDNAQFKFGGTSALFDGTNDVVTIFDNVDLTLGTSDFTVDFWFRCNKAGGTTARICGQSDSAATASTRSFSVVRSAGNVIAGTVFNSGSPTTVTGTTQFTDAVNTGWHHCAFVRTGNTLKLFLDGVQEGGDISFALSVTDSANALSIGNIGEIVDAQGWIGWLDEFRLSVGVARWTAVFTAPGKQYDYPGIRPSDGAVPGAVRGIFYARTTSGSVVVFAATSTRLFRLNNTDLSWVDVSKGGVAYTAVPNTDHWQFAQFGNLAIAVQANTVPQVFDISSATEFSDLAPGATVPQARYIAVVNRFVVLSGLVSTPYRIQWSGLNSVNAADSWTSGVSSSDFQDFPDGGVVRGVAGGEYGVVFQDGVIRSMIYAVGSAYIFQFIRIAEDKGLLAPYSIIRSGSNIFFLASQGFHKIVGSTVAPLPIGKDKVDSTFFGDYDQNALQMIIGTTDPQNTRVYWAYKSQAGTAGTFDKIMVFDYVLERWSVIIQSGDFISTVAAPGITLESLDSISLSLDALTFSLDDVALSALPKTVAADTTHRLGFFSGANVEATIDTSEQAITGKRARVSGLYPVTDAAGVFGAVGYRETLQATVSYSTEQVVTARGMCHANVSTRLARARMRIPAATTWTYATGFEPNFVPEGQR